MVIKMKRKEELIKIESLKNTKGGYVYILLADDNTVKIGITVHPYKRIGQIETSSGKEIVDWTISNPCLNYADIEVKLHRHFGESRLKGEWFNIKYNDAVKELNDMNFEPINYYNIEDKIMEGINIIRMCNVFAEVEHREYNYEKVKYNITYKIPTDVILEIKTMILNHYNANISEGADTSYLDDYVSNIRNNTNVTKTVVDYCLDYIDCVDLDILNELGLYDLFDKVLNFEIITCNVLAEETTENLLNDLYEQYGKELVEKVIRENY